MTGLPRTLRLRVAGITLSLAVPGGLPFPRLPGASRRFIASRGGEIRLRLSSEIPPEPAPSRLLFDSGQVWRVYRHGAGLLYTFDIPGRRPSTYKAVAIDRGMSSGILYLPRHADGPSLSTALDFPLDELLFQHRLAREGAVDLHACGIKAGAGVFLFCGHSGAGKTTTAWLWRRHCPAVSVLSDDRIVVRELRAGFRAYGTPWHGEAGYAEPGSGEIRSVCFLRHAAQSSLRRLPPPEAAARLFARTFPPLWQRDAVRNTLRTCCRLANELPCYDFGFRPDRSAVETIQETF